MPRNYALFAFALVSGGVLFGALASHRSLSGAAPAPIKTTAAKTGGAPVIVELFTSEGCSSCPPADALLMKLKRDQSNDGAEIIALSEHVDYWNSRAYTDPYSSAAFTARQTGYARAFHLDAPYTPQMVVDGREEFTGSDDESAASAIAKSVKSAKTDVEATGEVKEGSLQLKIKIAPVIGLPAGDKADVMLAITEDNLHSQVSGGENSGRKLTHVGVVRELKSLGALPKGAAWETVLTVPLKANWKRADLQAVVFVQAQNSRRILGATAIPVK